MSATPEAVAREAFAALDALEEAWVDPSTASTRALTALSARREELIGRLRGVDLSRLTPPDAAEVKRRMRRLVGRDRFLVDSVQVRRDRAKANLDGLVKGRAAVRGYQRGSAPTPPNFAGKL